MESCAVSFTLSNWPSRGMALRSLSRLKYSNPAPPPLRNGSVEGTNELRRRLLVSTSEYDVCRCSNHGDPLRGGCRSIPEKLPVRSRSSRNWVLKWCEFKLALSWGYLVLVWGCDIWNLNFTIRNKNSTRRKKHWRKGNLTSEIKCPVCIENETWIKYYKLQ